MKEYIYIKPEYEKLKSISPLWDNENESRQFEIHKYNELKKLIAEYNIGISIDDLCYIVILLEQEKQGINSEIKLKETRQTILKDRLEVSGILKKCQNDPTLTINAIKFEYGKNRFDKDSKKIKYYKEGSFSIADKEIIRGAIELIKKAYVYKSSYRSDFKEYLKYNIKINNKHSRCENLAKSLNRYLSDNSSLSLNRRYFVIGFLFQFAGIENEFSLERFNKNSDPSLSYQAPYKSYPDFVTKNIRSKYFKGVTKQSKKR